MSRQLLDRLSRYFLRLFFLRHHQARISMRPVLNIWSNVCWADHVPTGLRCTTNLSSRTRIRQERSASLPVSPSGHSRYCSNKNGNFPHRPNSSNSFDSFCEWISDDLMIYGGRDVITGPARETLLRIVSGPHNQEVKTRGQASNFHWTE